MPPVLRLQQRSFLLRVGTLRILSSLALPSLSSPPLSAIRQFKDSEHSIKQEFHLELSFNSLMTYWVRIVKKRGRLVTHIKLSSIFNKRSHKITLNLSSSSCRASSSFLNCKSASSCFLFSANNAISAWRVSHTRYLFQATCIDTTLQTSHYISKLRSFIPSLVRPLVHITSLCSFFSALAAIFFAFLVPILPVFSSSLPLPSAAGSERG